ncbi:hypothetical protein MPER_07771, partial [Moniliophthora perniciosa FA553]
INIAYATLERIIQLLDQFRASTSHSVVFVNSMLSIRVKEQQNDSERQSLAICLLLYGCDRNVVANNLILEEEVEAFPSRRKLTNRISEVVDPIVVDPSLMKILDAYLAVNNDDQYPAAGPDRHSIRVLAQSHRSRCPALQESYWKTYSNPIKIGNYDITGPVFSIEGHQWRASITDAFFYFFSSLWADEKVTA